MIPNGVYTLCRMLLHAFALLCRPSPDSHSRHTARSRGTGHIEVQGRYHEQAAVDRSDSYVEPVGRDRFPRPLQRAEPPALPSSSAVHDTTAGRRKHLGAPQRDTGHRHPIALTQDAVGRRGHSKPPHRGSGEGLQGPSSPVWWAGDDFLCAHFSAGSSACNAGSVLRSIFSRLSTAASGVARYFFATRSTSSDVTSE